MTDCALYLLSPAQIDDSDHFAAVLAAGLDGGPVACFQLRLKEPDGSAVPDDQVRRMAEKLLPICQTREVAFLLNDRPDLAKECGADGVHVGQTDQPLHAARALLGAEASIGVTCHNSRHLALEAGEAGADYVAFGAFFPSQTKQTATPATLDILTWWQAMTTVPCVAIGGISLANCQAVAEAGADFIAVSGAVWNHAAGPAAAVRAFGERLNSAP
ncbi:MAG: thiamine phosphate synthase [Pseudomonadota bacterium]